MNPALRVTAIAAIYALLLSACAASTGAKVDFDTDNNFSNYQSFTWLSKNPMKVGKTAFPPKKTLEPAVMAAIRTHLDASGYDYVEEASAADFLLSFTVGSRENSGSEAYASESSGVGARGGWATAYYGGSAGAAYTQGVLAIDVFDAVERQPVWHGVAGKRITDDDRETMTDVINDVVASILNDFPPQ
jgi:hypothetical protein